MASNGSDKTLGDVGKSLLGKSDPDEKLNAPAHEINPQKTKADPQSISVDMTGAKDAAEGPAPSSFVPKSVKERRLAKQELTTLEQQLQQKQQEANTALANLANAEKKYLASRDQADQIIQEEADQDQAGLAELAAIQAAAIEELDQAQIIIEQKVADLQNNKDIADEAEKQWLAASDKANKEQADRDKLQSRKETAFEKAKQKVSQAREDAKEMAEHASERDAAYTDELVVIQSQIDETLINIDQLNTQHDSLQHQVVHTKQKSSRAEAAKNAELAGLVTSYKEKIAEASAKQEAATDSFNACQERLADAAKAEATAIGIYNHSLSIPQRLAKTKEDFFTTVDNEYQRRIDNVKVRFEDLGAKQATYNNAQKEMIDTINTASKANEEAMEATQAFDFGRFQIKPSTYQADGDDDQTPVKINGADDAEGTEDQYVDNLRRRADEAMSTVQNQVETAETLMNEWMAADVEYVRLKEEAEIFAKRIVEDKAQVEQQYTKDLADTDKYIQQCKNKMEETGRIRSQAQHDWEAGYKKYAGAMQPMTTLYDQYAKGWQDMQADIQEARSTSRAMISEYNEQMTGQELHLASLDEQLQILLRDQEVKAQIAGDEKESRTNAMERKEQYIQKYEADMQTKEADLLLALSEIGLKSDESEAMLKAKRNLLDGKKAEIVKVQAEYDVALTKEKQIRDLADEKLNNKQEELRLAKEQKAAQSVAVQAKADEYYQVLQAARKQAAGLVDESIAISLTALESGYRLAVDDAEASLAEVTEQTVQAEQKYQADQADADAAQDQLKTATINAQSLRKETKNMSCDAQKRYEDIVKSKEEKLAELEKDWEQKDLVKEEGIQLCEKIKSDLATSDAKEEELIKSLAELTNQEKKLIAATPEQLEDLLINYHAAVKNEVKNFPRLQQDIDEHRRQINTANEASAKAKADWNDKVNKIQELHTEEKDILSQGEAKIAALETKGKDALAKENEAGDLLKGQKADLETAIAKEKELLTDIGNEIKTANEQLKKLEQDALAQFADAAKQKEQLNEQLTASQTDIQDKQQQLVEQQKALDAKEPESANGPKDQKNEALAQEIKGLRSQIKQANAALRQYTKQYHRNEKKTSRKLNAIDLELAATKKKDAADRDKMNNHLGQKKNEYETHQAQLTKMNNDLLDLKEQIKNSKSKSAELKKTAADDLAKAKESLEAAVLAKQLERVDAEQTAKNLDKQKDQAKSAVDIALQKMTQVETNYVKIDNEYAVACERLQDRYQSDKQELENRLVKIKTNIADTQDELELIKVNKRELSSALILAEKDCEAVITAQKQAIVAKEEFIKNRDDLLADLNEEKMRVLGRKEMECLAAESAAEEASTKYFTASIMAEQSLALCKELQLNQEIISANMERIKNKSQNNLAAAKANLTFHQLTAEE